MTKTDDPLHSGTIFAGLLTALAGRTVSRHVAGQMRDRGSSVAAVALVALLRMPREEREMLIAQHIGLSRDDLRRAIGD